MNVSLSLVMISHLNQKMCFFAFNKRNASCVLYTVWHGKTCETEVNRIIVVKEWNVCHIKIIHAKKNCKQCASEKNNIINRKTHGWATRQKTLERINMLSVLNPSQKIKNSIILIWKLKQMLCSHASRSQKWNESEK